MENTKLKQIIEAALLAAGRPLSVNNLMSLFAEDKEQAERAVIRDLIKELQKECEGRGVELKEVSSGFRYQANQDTSHWVSRLWGDKPSRYSRALLETLALISYRQPITRAEIEDVRGVSVSSSIMKTLMEREWIKIVGHREVVGKPAMFGTTKQFLDYFGLKSLSNLPELSEIMDLDTAAKQLNLDINEVRAAMEVDAHSEDEEASGENPSAMASVETLITDRGNAEFESDDETEAANM